MQLPCSLVAHLFVQLIRCQGVDQRGHQRRDQQLEDGVVASHRGLVEQPGGKIEQVDGRARAECHWISAAVEKVGAVDAEYEVSQGQLESTPLAARRITYIAHTPFSRSNGNNSDPNFDGVEQLGRVIAWVIAAKT
eukprot:scaffold133676_cov19-Prasinocladus_malaysianus.AAC.1